MGLTISESGIPDKFPAPSKFWIHVLDAEKAFFFSFFFFQGKLQALPDVKYVENDAWLQF